MSSLQLSAMIKVYFAHELLKGIHEGYITALTSSRNPVQKKGSHPKYVNPIVDAANVFSIYPTSSTKSTDYHFYFVYTLRSHSALGLSIVLYTSQSPSVILSCFSSQCLLTAYASSCCHVSIQKQSYF